MGVKLRKASKTKIVKILCHPSYSLYLLIANECWLVRNLECYLKMLSRIASAIGLRENILYVKSFPSCCLRIEIDVNGRSGSSTVPTKSGISGTEFTPKYALSTKQKQLIVRMPYKLNPNTIDKHTYKSHIISNNAGYLQDLTGP